MTSAASGWCSLLWLVALALGLALLAAAVVLPVLGVPAVVTDWWAKLTKTAASKKDDDEEQEQEQERDAQPTDAAASMDITGSSLTPAFVDPRRGSISREAMRVGAAAMTIELPPPLPRTTWSPSTVTTTAVDGGGARPTQAGTSGFTGLMHSGRDAVRADPPPQRPAFFSWQTAK